MMIEPVVSRATTLPWMALPAASCFRRLATARQSPTSLQPVGNLEHPHVACVFHDGLVDRHALEPGNSRARVSASAGVPMARRIGSSAFGELGVDASRISSRIVRARQTKIPEFQAKLPAARNRSAVARSGFSRN